MFIYYLSIITITYQIFNFCEYFLHKLAHDKNMGKLYRWHHNHHTVEFPVNKLVNNDFVSPPIYENIFLQIAIICWIYLYILLPLDLFSIIFIETLLLIYIDDYIHMSYHRDDTYLERFEWFQFYKKQHHLHHRNTTRNFNLFNNTYDVLFNTIKY